MFSNEQYELIDFGDGRRLERFGAFTLDRPCPAAEGVARQKPSAWALADASFEGREEEKGRWTYRRELPERWTIAHGAARFELKRTEFGHLGVFPEQAENWDWIAECCRAAMAEVGLQKMGTGSATSCNVSLSEQLSVAVPVPVFTRASEAADGAEVLPRGDGTRDEGPTALTPGPSPVSRERGGRVATPNGDSRERGDTAFKVLNLFGYTGGSTLAAAAAGAAVTHVDAARNVVAWARRNAEISGLADAPIRWIAEDAVKFAARELKRGNRYDAVILDPPSYGHGPHNEVWRLPDDLPRLLSRCRELTADRLAFMLLTCHTPGFEAEPLVELLDDAGFPASRAHVEAMPLSIRSIDGRSLPSGVVVRYSPQESSLALAVISNP